MKNKSLLIGVLAVAGIAFAGTKTYDVTISKPAKAGTVELAPGEYKLKVDGTTATFINSSRKSSTTPVKVETAAKKFQNTAIDSTNGAAKDTIHSITLGGSTTKVDFEQVSPGN